MVVSPVNGHWKLSIVVICLGLGLMFAPIWVWKLAGIALAPISWTANELDM